MPERIFKYATTEKLVGWLSDPQAFLSGTTQELRQGSTGFAARTGPVSQVDLQRRFLLMRYEVWLRGQGDANTPADSNCAALEPSNPLQERQMRVETIERVPNYMLPPFPNYP